MYPNYIKRIVSWLFVCTLLLLTSCIGDDVSDCGYDNQIQQDNLFLTFDYDVPNENHKDLEADGVNGFYLMAYHEDGTYSHSYVDKGFKVDGSKVDFTGIIDPGTYHFIFMTANTRGQFSPEGHESYDDICMTLIHDEECNREYVPMAYYHSVLENFQVKENAPTIHKASLEKITNEMVINITGLPEAGINPDLTEVDIYLPDMVFALNGQHVYEDHYVHYETKCETIDGIRSASVYTQPLNNEKESSIIVSYADQQTRERKVLVEADLVQLILEYLHTTGQSPDDLNIIHEFDIDIDIEDQYISISVNGWVVMESEQDIS